MSCICPLFARRALLVATLLAFAIGSGKSLAVGINDYQLTRSFTLPAPGTNSGGQVLFDALPNGRLLLLNGSAVSIETAPQSGAFTPLGNIAGFAPAFGPSFLSISPDGTHAAAGTNGGGSIAVFDTSNPTAVTNYLMQDFSAEWFNNRYLAVSNFTAGSTVQVLDTTTSSVTTVVSNIGGFSAGVSFDAAGNLYTGNAFDTAAGGTGTGWVKAFSATAWQNALATTTPLNFETTGTPVADLLTAYPVGFDTSGNMFVGGADFFGSSGDYGYAALVDAAAVGSALAIPQSSPPVTPASSAGALRKFASPPDTVTFQQPPNWNYNAATGELYLNYAFGGSSVNVYAPVPEPSCLFLVAACGILFGIRRAPKH